MTETAQVINTVIQTQDYTGQIFAAIVAVLLVLIPLGGLWLRSKMQAKVTEAEAQALEAQTRLLRAKKDLEEAQRLAESTVKGVEKATNQLVEAGILSVAEAKKTKGIMTAVAKDLGVAPALETMVDRLGFAHSKSKPEIQAPPEEGKDNQ